MKLTPQEQDFFTTSATQLAESDTELIESLVKSPVFGALKRFFKGYREACYQQLISSTDTSLLIRTQGQILSLNVLERLPEITIAQKVARSKAQAEAAAEEADSIKRREDYLRYGSRPKAPPLRKKSVDKS